MHIATRLTSRTLPDFATRLDCPTTPLSESFVQAAVAKGLRVREYAPPAGGRVQCTVTAEDDLLIARLAAELGRSKRVDVSLCDSLGREQMRMAGRLRNAKRFR